MANPITTSYDSTFPPDTQAANQLGADIRGLTLGVQQRMAFISGTLAERWWPGIDAQTTNWIGLLYFAIDTGTVFQWQGTQWVDVTSGIFGGGGGSNKFFAAQFTPPGTSPAVSVNIPASMLKVGTIIRVLGEVDAGAQAMGWNLSLNGIIVPTLQLTNAINNRSIFEANFTLNALSGGSWVVFYQGQVNTFPNSNPGVSSIFIVTGGIGVPTGPNFTFNLNSNSTVPAQVGPLSAVVWS